MGRERSLPPTTRIIAVSTDEVRPNGRGGSLHTCRAGLEVSRPSAFEVLAFRPGAVAAAATAVPQRSRVQ
ncbi:MAG: hypothetical protein WBZ67_14885, partial [Pseudolabrys sp.]